MPILHALAKHPHLMYRYKPRVFGGRGGEKKTHARVCGLFWFGFERGVLDGGRGENIK
jgi:hypothetical protein